MLTLARRTGKEAEFVLVSHEQIKLDGHKTASPSIMWEANTNKSVHSVIM